MPALLQSVDMKKQFGIVETSVMKDPKISVGAKALYALLCTYTSPSKPFAYPRLSEVAEYLGDIDTRTVRRYMTELKENKYLQRNNTDNGWIFLLLPKVKP